jgi:hypothetical protein
MKVGDLIKLNFESSALGVIIQKISPDDREWAGYGEWLVFFTTLGYEHPCFEAEMRVISDTD